MILSSMNEAKHTIHTLLECDNQVCVFPTETAAKFWIDSYVRLSSRKAVRLDKVIAWDRFRAKFLPVRSEQPTNGTIRLLFAQQLLGDEQIVSSLQWFTYPSHPDSIGNLAATLALLCTHLEDLDQMMKERPQAYLRLPKAYRDDTARIGVIYREFLREHSLFEPHFLQPSLDNFDSAKNRNIHYTVFFPEVCRGWAEFSAMKSFPDWITSCSIQNPDETENPNNILHWFSNELMELRDRLDKIEQLLDAHTPPEEIVITLGNADRWRPYVEHEAMIRDIPITFIQGRSPLSYSPGKFLQSILNLYTHQFSFDAMKSFLLDSRYPFKDRSIIQRLIQCGVEYSVVIGSTNPRTDRWLHVLESSKKAEDASVLSWYRTFRQQVIAIVRASTITSLRRALFACKEFTLGNTCWLDTASEHALPEESILNRVWAYCLDQLQAMGEDLETCGINELPALFSQYLHIIGKQEYIPQHHHRGIPVYSYTASVGISPAHHFLIGCTEDATRQISTKLPLIAESIWEDTELSDTTEPLLYHYRYLSDNTYWSASGSAFGGTSSLPPSLFIDRGEVQEESYVPSGRIYYEQTAWASENHTAWIASHNQAQWFSRAHFTAFSPPRIDFAESHPYFSLWKRFSLSDGTLGVSNTMLDAFAGCPMKWAAHYVFHLKKETYAVQSIDHRQLGIIMHRIYENFFREIAQRTGTFRKDLVDSLYREMLENIINAEFDRYARMPQAPSAAVMYYIREHYGPDLLAILKAESNLFSDYTSVAFEAPLTMTYHKAHYTLEGRIDRILKQVEDDGTEYIAVVDYKKSFNNRMKDFNPGNETIPTHQLPLYAKLIRDSSLISDGEHKAVTIGAYFAIDKGAYKVIWKAHEPQKRDWLIEKVEQRIDEMVNAIREGRLGVTTSGKPCIHCDYRQICRRRYALI